MTSGDVGPSEVVLGRPVDDETRCVHWRSPLDVVAIEFACCRRLYPCRSCHDETADHPARRWPAGSGDVPAVLCGVCRRRLPIAAYLAGPDACPHCAAPFNPGCRLHHHLYFDEPVPEPDPEPGRPDAETDIPGAVPGSARDHP